LVLTALSAVAKDSVLRAVIGVPLLSQNQVIGVLGLAHTVKGREFGEGDVEVLRRFAPLASLALDNARLFAQTQTALDETTRLYAASRRLVAAQGLQALVAAVVEGVPNPAINRAILILFERDNHGIVTAGESVANWHGGRGTPPNPIGRRYPAEVFQIAPILFSQEPLFFDDAYHDPRLDAATRVLVMQQKIRAFAVLPLWGSAQQSGILVIQADEPHHFTEQEIRPYLSLTQQMSVAIENQRLLAQAQKTLAQAQRFAQREQAIADATERLHQAGDVRSVMRVAAQELQKATGSTRMVVRLRREPAPSNPLPSKEGLNAPTAQTKESG
jgi:GAF domain-containing protein